MQACLHPSCHSTSGTGAHNPSEGSVAALLHEGNCCPSRVSQWSRPHSPWAGCSSVCCWQHMHAAGCSTATTGPGVQLQAGLAGGWVVQWPAGSTKVGRVAPARFSGRPRPPKVGRVAPARHTQHTGTHKRGHTHWEQSGQQPGSCYQKEVGSALRGLAVLLGLSGRARGGVAACRRTAHARGVVWQCGLLRHVMIWRSIAKGVLKHARSMGAQDKGNSAGCRTGGARTL
jgi:hypothetical protein